MAREMPVGFYRTQKYDHGIGQICPTIRAVDISDDCGNPNARPPINLIYSRLQNVGAFAIVEIGLRREELHYEEFRRNPRELDRLPFGFREIARVTKVEPKKLAQLILDNAPPDADEKKRHGEFAHPGARRP